MNEYIQMFQKLARPYEPAAVVNVEKMPHVKRVSRAKDPRPWLKDHRGDEVYIPSVFVIDKGASFLVELVSFDEEIPEGTVYLHFNSQYYHLRPEQVKRFVERAEKFCGEKKPEIPIEKQSIIRRW